MSATQGQQRKRIGQADDVRVTLVTDPPGVVRFSGAPEVKVSIHVGPSIEADCRRLGQRHRGRTIHGDVEIIPPHVSSVWEIKEQDTVLVIALERGILDRVAEASDLDPARLEVMNRFQVRDPRIEHIGWALQSEMERGYPGGRVFVEGLAAALATIVVQDHSSLSRFAHAGRPVLLNGALRRVIGYIEDNLSRDLSLGDMAAVAGIGVTHFIRQFRRATGVPPHQYIIRRRVERAAALLRRGQLPLSRVALETGFCHQSHLAKHMRRLLGATPKEIRDGAA